MTAYRLTNLRCEYLTNPLAIEAQRPRLSWEGVCDRHGAAQSAYRVIAAGSAADLKAGKKLLWDSGKVASNQSMHIEYAGKALRSRQTVFWKVMIWDETGKPSAWSKIASWTMGLLKPGDWKGDWIGFYLTNVHAVPLFRKEFRLKKQPKRALLYASARGLYNLSINGRDVQDDVFAPGWTDYNKRLPYRCYDVTKHLKPGASCIGAELAEGWFKGTIGWSGHCGHYGGETALRVNLYIEYADGSSEVIATDKTWGAILGPIRRAGFYEGQTEDAQLTPAGWNKPGFKGFGWQTSAVRKVDPKIPLAAYPAEPVRRTQELRPINSWAVAPGKIIYDFGQNFAGRVRIKLNVKPGTVIQMRFAEMVNLDQTLYVDNLRSAISTDTYVAAGRRDETWEPTFTFHGFRYVEISGAPKKLGFDDVTGVVLGSDTTRVGRFECSSDLVNKIYSNSLWTQRANFLEAPTDCPQRDERLGWTGDAQVFIRTAICNMDTAAFFTKWMDDMIDSQFADGAIPNVIPNVLGDRHKADAAWGDAAVVCPTTLYACYEDRRLLEKTYPIMKGWVAYLQKTSKNFLRGQQYFQTMSFADWLAIPTPTPKDVVQTAHFALAANLTRQAAEILGKTAEAKKYAVLFDNIRKAFNKAFVSANGKIEGDTQTAYLMAIKFGLLSPEKAKQAAKHLADDIRKRKHLSTGFIGTALIMSVLRDTGNLDLAYMLLENTTFPSWGYSVVNGATTIWERWNGWSTETGPGDVHMNSYSHYAYGAVTEWLFDTVAGIDHGGVGFQHFRLAPRPGGSLKWAKAEFNSPYGRIASGWKKRGKQVIYNVIIPANTATTVSLPTTDLAKVKLDGRPMDKTCVTIAKDGTFELPAGEYEITFPA